MQLIWWLLIIFLLYKNWWNIWDLKIRYNGRKMWTVIDSMSFTKIKDPLDIPIFLRHKIKIIRNIPKYDPNNKRHFIHGILSKIDDTFRVDGKLNVIDFLDFKGYSFSPHTDIEWNLIENDGFQVWALLENTREDGRGNMFFVHNPILLKKYRHLAITLRVDDDEVIIAKNCKFGPRDLERIKISDFIATTRLFYIDINPGDAVIFAKDICHVSDRTGSDKRHAINFRVVYDDLKIIPDSNCGFKFSPTIYKFNQ